MIVTNGISASWVWFLFATRNLHQTIISSINGLLEFCPGCGISPYNWFQRGVPVHCKILWQHLCRSTSQIRGNVTNWFALFFFQIIHDWRMIWLQFKFESVFFTAVKFKMVVHSNFSLKWNLFGEGKIENSIQRQWKLYSRDRSCVRSEAWNRYQANRTISAGSP